MKESIGWLFDENVSHFLQFVASSLQYDLIPEELEAYVGIIRTADAERDVWCRIALPTCTLYMARDSGTFVVHVEIDGPTLLAGELRGVVAYLACYTSTARS